MTFRIFAARRSGTTRRVPSDDLDLTTAGLVVAATLVVQLPFRLLGVSPADEGGVLQFATDILRGGHLYTHAIVYAFPGVFWLAAALFALFGTTIEVARTSAAVVFAVTCGIVYLLARWTHGRAGSVALVVVMLCYRVWAYPHWQILNYSSLAVALALAALWLAGEGARRDAWPWLVCAGAVAGGAVLAKQDSGAATALALGTGVLLVGGARRWRLAAATAAGGVVVLALAALWAWHAGYLDALVREAIVAPLYGQQHFDYLGRPDLWPLWDQDPALRKHFFSYVPPILFDTYGIPLLQSALYRRTPLADLALKALFHLPWIVVVLAFVRLARREARTPDAVLLVAVAVGFLAAFSRPRDWAHLIVLYPATLVLVAWVAAPLMRLAVVRIAGIAAVAAAGVASLLVLRAFAAQYATPIHAARGTLYARAGQAIPLQQALDAVARTPAGAPVASFPYHAIVNFLSGRPGVTRYYVVWPVDANPHRDDEVVADLDRHPDAVVVYHANEVPDFPRFRAYAPRLFAHLVERWAIADVFGGDPAGATILLLAPRPPAPPDRPLPLEAATVVAPGVRARFAEQALIAATAWPFDEVLRVTTQPAGAVELHVPLVPAAGERVETACTYNPERFGEVFVPPSTCAVAIVADGARTEVASRRLDPLRRLEDRRVAPVSVDLAAWAGRPIELVLSIEGPHGAPADANLVGWVRPRLVGAR